MKKLLIATGIFIGFFSQSLAQRLEHLNLLSSNLWTVSRPQTLHPRGHNSFVISGDIYANGIQTSRGLATLFTLKMLDMNGDSINQLVSSDYSFGRTSALTSTSHSYLLEGLYNAPRAGITSIDTNGVISRFTDFYSDSLLYNKLFNPESIYSLRDGTRLVIGTVSVAPPMQQSGTSIVAICIDQNNIMLWKSVFSNGYHMAMPESVCQDPLGNIHVASRAGSRYFVSRLDTTGRLLGHQLVFQHPGNRQIMSEPKIVSDGSNLYMSIYDDTNRIYRANMASGFQFRRIATSPKSLSFLYALSDGNILTYGNPFGNHKFFVLEPNSGRLLDSLHIVSPQNGSTVYVSLATPHHDGKHYAIVYPIRGGNPLFIRFSGIAPGIAPGVRVPPTVTSQAAMRSAVRLAAFPNPTTGVVRFTGLPEGVSTLHWVDGLGRTVLTQSIPQTSEGEFETTFNLPKGLYSVQAGRGFVKVVVE